MKKHKIIVTTDNHSIIEIIENICNTVSDIGANGTYVDYEIKKAKLNE